MSHPSLLVSPWPVTTSQTQVPQTIYAQYKLPGSSGSDSYEEQKDWLSSSPVYPRFRSSSQEADRGSSTTAAGAEEVEEEANAPSTPADATDTSSVSSFNQSVSSTIEEDVPSPSSPRAMHSPGVPSAIHPAFDFTGGSPSSSSSMPQGDSLTPFQNIDCINNAMVGNAASPSSPLGTPSLDPVAGLVRSDPNTLDTPFDFNTSSSATTPIPNLSFSSSTQDMDCVDSNTDVSAKSSNSSSEHRSVGIRDFPFSYFQCSKSSSSRRRRKLPECRKSPFTSPKESPSSGLVDSGCLSPNDTSSGDTGSGTSPAFPSEPTILAEKYIILGPLDASTAHAVHISNHRPLHIKAVTSRTAREVASQQAVLGEGGGGGVREPHEIVLSRCGSRAWLVFPRHFGDLHSYVRLRRRLREAEAQRLFGQVAATVERCHSAGLVLRDLKLRKFVFTDTSRQEVVLESVEDSVLAGEGDLLHDKHGCPAYVAPEILTTSAYSGRHADMWGLGVILYTMLVGRYPFHNPDTSTLFAYIRSGKFSIPNWVSSRARHLIMSLLRRVPSKRLSAGQVLAHPWLTKAPRDHGSKEQEDYVVPVFPSSSPSPILGKSLCPHSHGSSRSSRHHSLHSSF